MKHLGAFLSSQSHILRGTEGWKTPEKSCGSKRQVGGGQVQAEMGEQSQEKEMDEQHHIDVVPGEHEQIITKMA